MFVVLGCLAGVLFGAGMIRTPGADGVGVMGVVLITSINCLLYFSSFACLLIVLALITLLLMPRMFSFVDVSLPSQMAGRNFASIFGKLLTVGSR